MHSKEGYPYKSQIQDSYYIFIMPKIAIDGDWAQPTPREAGFSVYAFRRYVVVAGSAWVTSMRRGVDIISQPLPRPSHPVNVTDRLSVLC